MPNLTKLSRRGPTGQGGTITTESGAIQTSDVREAGRQRSALLSEASEIDKLIKQGISSQELEKRLEGFKGRSQQLGSLITVKDPNIVSEEGFTFQGDIDRFKKQLFLKQQEEGREKRIGEAKSEQEKLLGQIGQQSTLAQQAVDTQLAALLQETGIGANLARSQVGESFAERNLGRSTFAQKGIEDVTLSELTQKSQERLQAAEQKQRIKDVEQQTREQIQREDKQLAIEREFAKEQQFRTELFEQKKFEAQQAFNEEIARIQKSARSKSLTSSIVGGIFAGAGTIFGGGFGGAIGGAVGRKISGG